MVVATSSAISRRPATAPDAPAIFLALRPIVATASFRCGLKQRLVHAGIDPRTFGGELLLIIEAAVQDLLERGRRAEAVGVDIRIGDVFCSFRGVLLDNDERVFARTDSRS